MIYSVARLEIGKKAKEKGGNRRVKKTMGLSLRPSLSWVYCTRPKGVILHLNPDRGLRSYSLWGFTKILQRFSNPHLLLRIDLRKTDEVVDMKGTELPML